MTKIFRNSTWAQRGCGPDDPAVLIVVHPQRGHTGGGNCRDGRAVNAAPWWRRFARIIHQGPAAAGARLERPGCSLCMGNQARVADNAVVFSTSTCNFDNRMGAGAQVFLGSAELGAACALLGRIPTVDEYFQLRKERIAGREGEIYRYLSFDQMEAYRA